MTDLTVTPSLIATFIAASIQSHLDYGSTLEYSVEYSVDDRLADTAYEVHAQDISADILAKLEEGHEFSASLVQAALENIRG